VRGAASLQYGTQFGGMINFVFKQPPTDKPIETISRQTVGSFGFFNSFNSVAGTKGKLSYYTFYQYKRGDGWRENSSFGVHNAFASLKYKATDKLTLGVEYTYMDYLTQQPGGLTDVDFKNNPRRSTRSRNWFELHWNLGAITADYKLGSHTRLNIRNFGLIASRNAVGSLGYISRPDDDRERDLMSDHYRNFGNETRLIHTYSFLKNTSIFLIGTRYYNGFTHRQQGFSDNTDKPNFRFLHPNDLEHSDFRFPGSNFAIFAENIFTLSPKLSITPGFRFEHIKTTSDGYFNEEYVLFEGDNTIVVRNKLFDQKKSIRSFPLFGIGVSYRPTAQTEVYGNLSQNYRAINFNDLRVFNPNIEVDENLKDENGCNADLGFRGQIKDFLNLDVSAFLLSYNDRIGSVLQRDEATSRIYRYRTNIANSRHTGLETFWELDFLKLINGSTAKIGLSLFSNITALSARYISADQRFDGKKVELAPSMIIRSGITLKRDMFSTTLQYSYTGKQFSDASNAILTPTAIEGEIPAYSILDLSAKYDYKFLTLAAGINNLTNSMYFTRRAISYPGPGIIPADGRNLYLTLGVRL
jgi:Fe(3+) dicitrate transport protein